METRARPCSYKTDFLGVLEVTMRDGNKYQPPSESKPKIKVLEVTMRDGNLRFFIEKKTPLNFLSFRSDYEGWKPFSSPSSSSLSRDFTVLEVTMRDGN